MKTHRLLSLILAVTITPVIAADYLSTSPANNLPNENGQFIYIASDTESFYKYEYISTTPNGTLPAKDGRFVYSGSNDCTQNCVSTEYRSTSPANNLPNENGQFIYKPIN